MIDLLSARPDLPALLATVLGVGVGLWLLAPLIRWTGALLAVATVLGLVALWAGVW